jgi:ATP-dependent DNA helicase DinG
MLMRQGAGRLIRRDSDVGVIAVLDPRIRLKGYGEEILRNLPPDMRVFDDPEEAFGALGIDSADLRQAVE